MNTVHLANREIFFLVPGVSVKEMFYGRETA